MKLDWADGVCEEHLLNLEPDAAYAMEDCGVPKQIQAKISFAGFKTDNGQTKGFGGQQG